MTAVTQTKPEQISQAVFSVCASADVAASAMAAVLTVAGGEFIGQFAEYITAEKRPHFPEALTAAASCVALIDCDQQPERALETMERLQQMLPRRLHLIAFGARADADLLLKVMRAGCDDFLPLPLDKDLLAAALKRFSRSQHAEALATRGNGKVLSFFGVKGGVGTTTVAVHLAMQLVRKHRKRVLLIDYKHELGHIALHLGLKQSVYFFDELLRNAERLDTELLEGFVTRHSSGLDVIPSPNQCAPVPEGSQQAIHSVLNYLRLRYDFILIDSSLEYRGSFGAITSASDEIALVATPDVASMRDLIRRIEHLATVPGFTDRLKVIINRSTSNDAINTDDIAATIKFPISVSIPNNYAGLVNALNLGETLRPTPRCVFSQAISAWSDRLVPEQATLPAAAAPSKRRGFFTLTR